MSFKRGTPFMPPLHHLPHPSALKHSPPLSLSCDLPVYINTTSNPTSPPPKKPEKILNCPPQKKKKNNNQCDHPALASTYMMQKQSIFFVLLLLFLVSSRANAQRKGLVGGRTAVKDVKKNKEVQDLGRFSVEEYNRSLMEDMPPSPLRGVVGDDGGPNGRLMFLEVVEAQTQVVAGLKYYLKVAAMQDGVPKTFDAVVVVKPWESQSKKLLNFGPSHN